MDQTTEELSMYLRIKSPFLDPLKNVDFQAEVSALFNTNQSF